MRQQRPAKVMLGDQSAAEDVVQDAFVGMYRRWPSLQHRDKALGYLRASVLNGTCDSGVDTVLWSDDSARHVLGEQQLFQRNPRQYTDRYGVAAAGQFAEFPVPQHGQWYSGPAF
jgi:Sigma-70 region 2